MMGLTRKQAQALQFIRSFIAERDYPPSIAEITAGLGLKSRGGVTRLVVALEERGYIRRIPRRARAIELVENDDDLVRLSPHVSRFIADYAARTRSPSKDAAVNELLAEYLGKVAA
ncbi:LexA family protein [Pseudorhodoplanes sp.]|uniref:LexA family protein n=1 Tax=Pseudorhodoplanes sp. TaxID=1934341 RepID=UPI002BAFB5D0|nr:MarR family transcriptional regulator [Pseudorhodoplanes sp.]HWV44091.1 MarR family transcriptional regulator [Pseudorhodoplanes sp.]